MMSVPATEKGLAAACNTDRGSFRDLTYHVYFVLVAVTVTTFLPESPQKSHVVATGDG